MSHSRQARVPSPVLNSLSASLGDIGRALTRPMVFHTKVERKIVGDAALVMRRLALQGFQVITGPRAPDLTATHIVLGPSGIHPIYVCDAGDLGDSRSRLRKRILEARSQAPVLAGRLQLRRDEMVRPIVCLPGSPGLNDPMTVGGARIVSISQLAEMLLTEKPVLDPGRVVQLASIAWASGFRSH